MPESGHLWVNHVIVGGGPCEDRKVPRLRPDLFVRGREVVLFAQKDFPGLEKGVYVSGDDPLGVLFVEGEHLFVPRTP